MSKLNAFVQKLKSSQAQLVRPESRPQPQPEPVVEARPEVIKSAYIARRPHAKTQKRNEKFAEFITSDEAQALIKDIKNTKKLKTLVDAFKTKFNESIPLVTAYSIFNQLRN